MAATATPPTRPMRDPRRINDLIPNVLDYLAASNPDGTFAEYPISPVSFQDGYQKVTYGAFANAVNGLASWLRHTLGPPKTPYEVIAYMGPNDLRYPALVLGAVKAGYTLFLTSPRNSVPAQMVMFEGISCTTVLSSSPRLPQVQAIADAHSHIRVEEVPEVQDLLRKTHEHFVYEKTCAEERDKPMFIAHTSGSTGFPKTLVYTHETGLRETRLMLLEPPEGYTSQPEQFEGKRMFMTFPPFHAAYFAMSLFNCIPLGTVFLAPLAGAIASAESLVEGLKHSQADIAFIVPMLVLELAQNPDLVDFCAQNLEYIMYCGGDLPQHIGDTVSSKIKLVNQYGATELGICHQLDSKTDYDPKDWKYVQFHPDAGYEFRPAVGDTYELYVVRNPVLEAQQPSFTIFPGTEEYCTRDLFTRHPTKPDFWRWKARADDIIVFLNGEKTNPVAMEQHIVAKNLEVTAALVAGTYRFQAALLLEIDRSRDLSIQERAALIEKIWPTIQEANHECPAYAKIAKSHILFTTSDRPVIRTGKGTIQRAGTLAMYATEIDALYVDADRIRDIPNGDVMHVDVDDHLALSAFVRDTFTLAIERETISETDDFFQLGLDSFQALLAVRTLRQVLKIPDLGLSFIYTHPSMETLVPALVKLAHHQYASEESQVQTLLAEREAVLQEMQSLLTATVDVDKNVSRPAKRTVILTGSTGALGSYVLAQLLDDPSIEHVYCLNRGANSEQLQSARNATRGLPTVFPADRVTFLTADLTKSSLGLTSIVYEELRTHVTLIIHAAWPVNFNLSLSSFRPSLIGLVNLIKYTATGLKNPHLHYVSSIGSIIGLAKDDSFPSHDIPEVVPPSALVPRLNGYSESKYVAELLLDQAAKDLGLSVSLSRVGQVAGAIGGPGLWNPQEWFPSLVLTSSHISALPQSLGKMGRVDWLPIDVLTSVLIELTMQETGAEESKNLTAHVFNLAHPHPSTWSALLPSVTMALESCTGKKIKVVSSAEWIDLVQKDMEEAGGAIDKRVEIGGVEGLASQLKNNPAVKLLNFYKDIMLDSTSGNQDGETILNMDHTLQRSKKLRSLSKFQPSWVMKWVDEWMANKETLPIRSG